MKVYTVVLNWNSAEHTIACVQSLLDTDFDDFAIAVVDNGSTDGSTVRLRAFLGGLEQTGPPEIAPGCDHGTTAAYRMNDGPCSSITLIEMPNNRGYAAGNNVGVRRGLDLGVEFVWILNNDTAVSSSTMRLLVNCASRRPQAAAVGSVVIDYDEPHHMQYIGGGRFNPWLTRNAYPGFGLAQADVADWSEPVDYVGGASLFCRADVLGATGGLCEDYFLFYEELDFAEHAKRLGYGIAVEVGATVYHRGGPAQAWTSDHRSVMAAYHGTRSCFVFLRRWHPRAVPVAVAVRLIYALWLMPSDFAVALAALRGMFSGLAYRCFVEDAERHTG